VAEPGRSASKNLQERLLPALEMSLGTGFHPQHSRLIPEGKAAGLAALQLARELLDSGRVKGCLVAGVDSFLNGADLQQAVRERRLKTRKNSDGFHPGEAAAALLLRARVRPEARRRVEISGIGLDQEQATLGSGKPVLGVALAQAARKALAEARMQMHEVDLRLADLNGEQHGFMEQAHAIARLVRQRKPTFPLEYMADCIGEVGAASGPCLLVMGGYSLLSEETACRSAVVFSSSDSGLRATAILRREEN
jgi:3-oxoacyl-[acyl-carrier-protein] synthase-1